MPVIRPDDRELVKARLRTVLDDWCNKVCEGVRLGRRSAMNRWAKAMGVAGGMVEVNIALAITNELGVPLDQARKLIHLAQSVEGLEDADAVSIMEQHVREFYRQRGKRMVILDEVEEVA